MRRLAVWLLGVAAVAAVLLAVRWLESLGTRPAAEGTPVAAAPPSAAPAAPPASEPPAPGPAPEADAGTDAGAERPPGVPPGVVIEPDTAPVLDGTWEAVDLEAVRRALPDNLYWQTASPTDDPRVQRERDDERARWNDEYGKVLSGTATEDEIRAYYAHRQRLSEDYVAFVNHVLEHYGDEIPGRDVGLLRLARTLHQKRLEELPRKQQEAFERKRQQDAAREAWLAEQAELDADTPE